jgi:hypothetical protein
MVIFNSYVKLAEGTAKIPNVIVAGPQKFSVSTGQL